MGWLDTVKKFFTRETAGQVATLARGASGEGMMPRTLPLAPDSGMSGQYQQLATMLAVDSDLLLRYADYENMDESSGEISAALDIYADDATISDAVHGRIIWGTSKDKIVRDIINDLLERRIRIEEDIWTAIRTLTKYGNCFCEIVVNDKGVLGLNWLPPPTMRRIVDAQGHLVGFVQDPTGAFAFQLGTQEDMEKLRAPTGAAGGGTAVFFYPWEVVHWRLTGRQMRALYGFSVVESARWVWKRLMMLEDSSLVLKLCLHGDTLVWTPGGAQEIRNLEEGDDVFSYSPGGKLVKTQVVYKKHNGTDRLFRITSKHREIIANATHPVLVEWFAGHGKGIPRTRFQEYVEVQNLKPGEHRFITPSIEDDVCDYVPLAMPDVGQKARLSPSSLSSVAMQFSPNILGSRCNVRPPFVTSFFAGEYEISIGVAIRLLRENGTSLDVLDVRDDWGGARPTLPVVADEDFARWFGFMIGDGWASERPSRQGSREYMVREIGFATGVDEAINAKYRALFERFFGPSRFAKSNKSPHENVGAVVISSKAAVEFMALNGFITGAHNKRIPQWVFESPVSVRLAFMEGLADADGHTREMSVGDVHAKVRFERVTLEMCNRDLLEDVRLLCMQTGMVVGSVHSRDRKGGRTIAGNDKPLPDTQSHSLSYSFDRMPLSETIDSVEEVEQDDIWDIGVIADEHNFVANGVVVHNTKAPARFAFYVDTGELPPREARAMVDEVRRRYKKKRIVDTATGKLDFRMNPLENSEDFFIPTRAGKEASRIDVLAGPDYDDTNVLQYFLKKLYAALRIPPQYLGGQEATNRSALSMEDVQFARMEMRIQREFITGLNQVVRVHLAALNIDPDSVKWALRMAAPSSIFEMQQIEVWNARAGLAGALRDFFTMPWIIANIFHLSDDDALFATESKQNENEAEALKQAQIQADILQRYPELGAAPPALGEAVERKPDSRALAEGVRRDIRQIVQEVMPDNGEVLRRLGRIEPAVERLERRLSGVRR